MGAMVKTGSRSETSLQAEISSRLRARLIPCFEGHAHPQHWECGQCGKQFYRPAETLDRTGDFPPVRTWLEFEQHECGTLSAPGQKVSERAAPRP